ncbi:uncharacterized protein LOC143302299 isoform X2 [Babylonia areolata]
MLSRNHAVLMTLMVTLVTAVLRVYYVTLKTSGWVLHPDEIYQSLEVAYSEIYGYGFRPYEFLPPARGDNLSQYQQVHQEHGMYALRSPLLPWFYVVVSWGVAMLGVTSPSPYLIWRIVHVTLASLLPLAAHVFTSTLSAGSHDVGVMAAALAASSVHLTVLGTHTIVHSLLAPALFLCLAGLHGSVWDTTAPRPPRLLHATTDSNTGTRRSGSTASSQNGSCGSHVRPEDKHSTTRLQTRSGSITQTEHYDDDDVDDVSDRSLFSAHEDTATSADHDDHTPLAGSSETVNGTSQNPKKAVSLSSKTIVFGRFIACGFCLAICCYIRPDSGLFIGILFMSFLSPRRLSRLLMKEKEYFRQIVLCVVGGILGVVVGISGDFYFYGVGVISPVNWFRFNVVSKAAGRLFGADSAVLYIREMFFANPGMVLVLGINIAGVMTSIVQALRRGRGGEGMALKMRLLVSVAVLLATYSVQEHKELRFIHHVIVLYFALTAINVRSLAKTLSEQGALTISATPRLSALGTILLFAASQWHSMPTGEDPASLKSWVYQGNADTYDVTRCVNHVAAQTDVRGVFLNVNLNLVGGFTFLRHNVPLLTLTFSGYHEYGMSARHITPRKLYPTTTATATTALRRHKTDSAVSLATSVNLSNYFDHQNQPYLLHHLISHPEYNYLLMTTDTEFLPAGFTQVLDTGRVKVLRRLGTEEGEQRLRQVVPLLRADPAPAVLKREASELFAFGLRDLAAQRYERGVRLDGQ